MYKYCFYFYFVQLLKTRGLVIVVEICFTITIFFVVAANASMSFLCFIYFILLYLLEFIS
jgi:hypothetical protein